VALVLVATGVVGVAAAFVIVVAGAVDWGPPESAAYATYALVNRLFGVAISLTIAAPLALRAVLAARPEARPVREALIAIALALGGMAAGSVAEFWIFNDQPYQGEGSAGRNISWITFLVSGLFLIGAAVVTGALLLRHAGVPRWSGAAVAGAPIFGIIAATRGISAFVVVPLVGLALCLVAVSLARRTPHLASMSA
jgi:hypothetical protein